MHGNSQHKKINIVEEQCLKLLHRTACPAERWK